MSVGELTNRSNVTGPIICCEKSLNGVDLEDSVKFENVGDLNRLSSVSLIAACWHLRRQKQVSGILCLVSIISPV